MTMKLSFCEAFGEYNWHPMKKWAVMDRSVICKETHIRVNEMVLVTTL